MPDDYSGFIPAKTDDYSGFVPAAKPKAAPVKKTEESFLPGGVLMPREEAPRPKLTDTFRDPNAGFAYGTDPATGEQVRVRIREGLGVSPRQKARAIGGLTTPGGGMGAAIAGAIDPLVNVAGKVFAGKQITPNEAGWAALTFAGPPQARGAGQAGEGALGILRRAAMAADKKGAVGKVAAKALDVVPTVYQKVAKPAGRATEDIVVNPRSRLKLKPKGSQGAVKEGQIQAGSQPERVGVGPLGPTAEAGGGDRVVRGPAYRQGKGLTVKPRTPTKPEAQGQGAPEVVPPVPTSGNTVREIVRLLRSTKDPDITPLSGANDYDFGDAIVVAYRPKGTMVFEISNAAGEKRYIFRGPAGNSKTYTRLQDAMTALKNNAIAGQRGIAGGVDLDEIVYPSSQTAPVRVTPEVAPVGTTPPVTPRVTSGKPPSAGTKPVDKTLEADLQVLNEEKVDNLAWFDQQISDLKQKKSDILGKGVRDNQMRSQFDSDIRSLEYQKAIAAKEADDAIEARMASATATPTKPPVAPRVTEVERSEVINNLGSEGYIEAKKNPAGHYQLFFRGTRNEVFPGEKFTSANEARQYWKVQKAKQDASPTPRVTSGKPATVAPAADPEVPPGVTGPANVITEAERSARGLPPVSKQEYKLTQDAVSAGERVATERDMGALAAEVANKPRDLSYDEVSGLAYDRARLNNEWHDLKQKPSSPEVEAQLDRVEAALDLNDQALQRGGREQSAAFAARRVLIAQDMSYAGMLRRARRSKAAQTGDANAQLTPQEKAKVQNEAVSREQDLARIRELETQGAAKQVELEAVIAEQDKRIQGLLAEAQGKKTAAREGQAPATARRRQSREQLEAERDKIKADLDKAWRKLTGQANAGIPPELWEVAPIMGRLVKNSVQRGVNTVEGIVSEAGSILKDIGIDYLTDREIRHILSGYGKPPKQLTAEAIAINKEVSRLKSAMTRISKLEDVVEGQRPKKGKPIEIDPANRQLDRDITTLMKQVGMTEPAKKKPTIIGRSIQQRQNAKETRLTNEIERLKIKIAAGGVPNSRSQIELTDSLKAKQAEYDALRAKNRKLVEASPGFKQQAEQRAVATKERALNRQIEKMEADLQAGRIGLRAKKLGVTSEKIEGMEKRLSDLRAQRDEMRLANQDWQVAQDTKRLADAKKRISERLTHLEDSMRSGTPMQKRTRAMLPNDPEVIALKMRLKTREGQYRQWEKQLGQTKLQKAAGYLSYYQKSNLLSGPAGATRDVFSTGFHQALDAFVERPIRSALGKDSTMGETPAAIKGWWAGLRRGIGEAAGVLRHGITEEEVSRFDFPEMRDLPGGMKNPINWPIRMRSALNAIQSEQGGMMERYALAYRQAKNEGLTGSAMKQRMDELIETPMPEMETAVHKFAKEMTYTQDEDKLLRGLYMIRNNVPGGRFVVPFMKTTYNLTKSGLTMTPLGFVRAGLSPKGQRLAPAVKAAFGSTVMASLAPYAADGKITGGVPEDEADRARFFDKGMKPYSIQIGNKWVEYKNFGALAIPIAITAGLFNRWENEGDRTSDDKQESIVGRAARSFGGVLVDNTALLGLSIQAEALMKGDVDKLAGGTLSGFVPAISLQRNITTAYDDVKRDPEAWYEWVVSDSFWRTNLPPKIIKSQGRRRILKNENQGANAFLPVRVWDGSINSRR